MRKLINNWWSIGFIIFVWFLFSYPYFLQHKVPFPSTYAVNFFSPWSAYHLYDGPVKNNAMPDIITQIYPWRYFTIQAWKQGQIPLWNPYSFSGTPQLANYQSAVLSPFNVLFFIFSFVDAWSILVLLQPLLAGLFTYIYCRSMQVSKTGSIVSSIAFMFCGFMTTWMDYATLGYAIVFLPLALFSVEKFLTTSKIRYLLLLSLTIPLSFFSGHFQISLYFLLFLFVYIVYKTISCRLDQTHPGLSATPPKRGYIPSIGGGRGWVIALNGRLLLFLFLAVFFGLLLAMPQILPSLELYTLSLRSSLFLKLEAIPLVYVPTFVAPDFFGNPVTRNDWFGHYAEWNGYIGLLPFMLGVYAIYSSLSPLPTPLRSEREQKEFPLRREGIKGRGRYAKSVSQKESHLIWFFGIISILCCLLAFSTPVLTILIALHIPVLSTSAASRIIVLFSFCFAILAGLGFDQLSGDLQKKYIRPIIVWLASFFVIFLFLWSVVILKLFLPLDKIPIAKQNLVFPTIIFVVSSVVILIEFVGFERLFHLSLILSSRRGKNRTLLLASCFLLLISFDLLRFATKWQPFDPRQFVFQPVSSVTNFPNKEPYERVYGDDGAEVSVYSHLASVEGYDPLYIQRYGEFIASLDGKVTLPERSVVTFPKNARYIPQAIKLLDISYIFQKNSDDNQPWSFPFKTYPLSQFVPVYTDGVYTIYKNNVPTSHVFLAQNYHIETNPQAILNDVFHQKNYRNTAVLEKDPHISQGGIAGNTQITNYSPNAISISSLTNKPALLFLSEVFYPGWNAYVDGKKTEIYRADYTFRSIVVPAGKHTIEFRYEPMSFTIGIWLVVVGIVGNIGLFFMRMYHEKST